MSSLPQAEPAWLTAEVSRLPQFMSWWSKAGLVGLCSTPAETQERTNLSWVHVESDPASSKLIDRLWAYCNVLVLHVYHWSAIAGHKKAMRKIGNRFKKNYCSATSAAIVIGASPVNLKAGGTKFWNQARYSARLSKTNLKLLDNAFTARQYMGN